MSKIKYLLLTNYIWKDLLPLDSLIKPGLYQWRQLFRGDVRLFSETPIEEYENYDIIHVNLCTNDIPIVYKVREILGNSSSTRLIMNIDYAVELWDKMFMDWKLFISSLRLPDLLFAVEPFQQQLLQIYTGKSIPLIPHPIDTKRLKEKRKEWDNRGDFILILYHRYDKMKMIPVTIASILKDYETIFIGLCDETDTEWRQMATMTPILGGMIDYTSYINILKNCKYAIEYYTIHSHGRIAGECACLGIPLIATTYNYYATLFYPYTVFPPTQIVRMIQVLKELDRNEDMRNTVIDKASIEVEQYSQESSKQRLLEVLDL